MDAVFDEGGAAAKPQTSARASRLVRAAMSGLLAAGAAGCASDDTDKALADAGSDVLSDEELKALCSDMVHDAKQDGADSVNLDKACAAKVDAAKSAAADDANGMCMVKLNDASTACSTEQKKLTVQVDTLTTSCEPLIGVTKDKIKRQEQKEYTFAQLTKQCEDRGGYVQVAAGCGGHNNCKGFSYGDWGPGAAMLTENSCAGSNSCLGILCTETANDLKRAPKDMYELEFPDPGPHHCISCHAPEGADHNPDKSKFVVWTYDTADNPHSGPELTLANWKDQHSAAYQEQVVAFGVQGVLPNGTGYNHMGAYYKYLSRAEIASLVQYIRNELEPVIKTVKTKDPP